MGVEGGRGCREGDRVKEGDTGGRGAIRGRGAGEWFDYPSDGEAHS